MATAFPTNPIFGETTALRVSMADVDGQSFTVSSGTLTVKNEAGTSLRSAVACTVDNDSTPARVYYIETFSAANGYAENAKYTATFKIVTSDAYTEKFEGTFLVKAANDE